MCSNQIRTSYLFFLFTGSCIYFPFYLFTDEPRGAYSQLTEEQKKDVRVLAGIGYTVRGDSRPNAGIENCLCNWF